MQGRQNWGDSYLLSKLFITYYYNGFSLAMGELCSSNKLTSTQLMTYNLFLYDKNFQTPGLKGCEKGKFSKRKSFSILEKNRRFGQKKKSGFKTYIGK